MAMNRKLAVEHSLEVKSPVTTTLAILLVRRGSTVDSTRPTERPWGVEVDCLLQGKVEPLHLDDACDSPSLFIWFAARDSPSEATVGK
jgi:hypothetical protein